MLARDKHSCLLRTFVNYGRIKFYNIESSKTNDNGATADTSGASGAASAAAAATGSENPKIVNVRPGLALGLITLQAGHRGPKISLH